MGYTIYFDGSGDYLLANSPAGDFGTSDFTVEALYKNRISQTSNPTIFSNYKTSSANSFGIFYPGYGIITGNTAKFSVTIGTSTKITGRKDFETNTYNHIAVSRRANTFTLFLNGLAIGANSFSANLSNSANITIGASQHDLAGTYLTGWIDGLRVIKNESIYNQTITVPSAQLSNNATDDIYYSNVSLLLHGNGTNNSTTIIDSSSSARTFSKVGNVIISSVQTKYGNGSIYFDGTGHLAITSPPEELQLTPYSKDWTIECWIYPTDLSKWATSDNPNLVGNMTSLIYWSFGPLTNGRLRFFSDASGGFVQYYHTTDDAVVANQWSHIAVTKTSEGITMWVNGKGYGPNSIAGSRVAVDFRLGGKDGANKIVGYVDDFRITYGVARYTSNFTPPTRLSLTPNTTLLTCNSSALNVSTGVPIDQSNSGYTITAFDNPGIAGDGFNLQTSIISVSSNASIGDGQAFVDYNTYSSLIATKSTYNTDYTGDGKIYGTVKKRISGNTEPMINTKVFLFPQNTKTLIAETTSNLTGHFAFTNLNRSIKYYVSSFDPVLQKNAVIADNITPEQM